MFLRANFFGLAIPIIFLFVKNYICPLNFNSLNFFHNIMRRNALYTLIIAGYFFLNNYSFSQSRLNPNPTKSLIFERQSFYPKEIKSVKQLPVKVVYNQYFFHNTNQSNLENHNGLYVPKGVGTLSSFLLVYNNN